MPNTAIADPKMNAARKGTWNSASVDTGPTGHGVVYAFTCRGGSAVAGRKV